jgi:hypothetical protein
MSFVARWSSLRSFLRLPASHIRGRRLEVTGCQHPERLRRLRASALPRSDHHCYSTHSARSATACSVTIFAHPSRRYRKHPVNDRGETLNADHRLQSNTSEWAFSKMLVLRRPLMHPLRKSDNKYTGSSETSDCIRAAGRPAGDESVVPQLSSMTSAVRGWRTQNAWRGGTPRRYRIHCIGPLAQSGRAADF